MKKLVKSIIGIIILSFAMVGCTTPKEDKSDKIDDTTKIEETTKEETTKEETTEVDESDETETENQVKIPVLMYHHFDEDETKATSPTVYTEEFKKQMKYLSDNGYTAITSQDLLDFKSGAKELPQKPIFITADDGYLSNYEYMYPVLKENGLKGTIFLIGERIDNAATGEGIPKVNWQQVKEMYKSGVMDFQSHTYDSHDKAQLEKISKGNFSVAYLDETEEEYRTRIDKDIKLSIDGFESNLGYKPIAFTYPYGEFSEISEEVLKNNGIKLSFTIKHGFVDDDENGYLLNRITVKGTDDFDTFIEKLNN